MECKEVKSHLDDYYDEILPDDLKDKVKDHLSKCEDCESDFKLLNNFLLQAKYLQTKIEAPKEIYDGISDQLIQMSSKSSESKKVFDQTQLKKIKKAMRLELSKEEKETSPVKEKRKGAKVSHSHNVKNTFWILFLITAIIGGYFLYEFSKGNSPWEIKADVGEYAINGVTTSSAELNEGDILATGNASSLRLILPDIGSATLSDNTKITLLKARDGDNILELKNGDIRIKTRIFQPGFSIVTDVVKIIDRGSDFRVSVESDSRNRIELNNGFIDIYFAEEKTTLSMGHICYVDTESGISIPHHIGATKSFINALSDFHLANNKADALEVILSEATELDAISLWYLLKECKPDDRRRVLGKLIEFYPLPADVSKEGIFNLDPNMLSLYWDEIEWQL